MVLPLLLNTALSVPMMNVMPAPGPYETIFYNPSENMTAIIFLSVGIVSFVLFCVYMVKKGCAKCGS